MNKFASYNNPRADYRRHQTDAYIESFNHRANAKARRQKAERTAKDILILASAFCIMLAIALAVYGSAVGWW